jgi:hypothetical protein
MMLPRRTSSLLADRFTVVSPAGILSCAWASGHEGQLCGARALDGGKQLVRRQNGVAAE